MLLKSSKFWLEILQKDDFPWNFWSFVSYQIMNVMRTAFVATFKVQFSLVAQSCLTLCDHMGYSMPGFPVHHQLLEPLQTHVHGVGDAIQPSHPLSSCLRSCVMSFPVSQFFVSGGQSIGVSASASVLPMNIQDWFPLGLTDLISCSPRDSQESSPTPQFKSINSSTLSFFLWCVCVSV